MYRILLYRKRLLNKWVFLSLIINYYIYLLSKEIYYNYIKIKIMKKTILTLAIAIIASLSISAVAQCPNAGKCQKTEQCEGKKECKKECDKKCDKKCEKKKDCKKQCDKKKECKKACKKSCK